MSETVLHQILNRSGFSPVTKDKYRLVIDRWIEFAGTNPERWTRDRAQEFYDQLIAGGISVQSANIYLASLRYVSRWYATKSGGVDFAVVQKQRGTKGKTRKADDEEPILEQEEAEALIETCRELTPIDMRDLALIVIGLETGMRRMSFRGMTFEGISTRKGYPIATVPIKGPGGEETFPVPLSTTAYNALSCWMMWLKCLKKPIKTGPIFRRLTRHRDYSGEVDYGYGDALSPTGINELVEARGKSAGIRHVNPHLFRHTFISWRSMAGFSPLEISAVTGHKVSIVSVQGLQLKIGDMRTYFHQDVERIRASTPEWLSDLVNDILTVK